MGSPSTGNARPYEGNGHYYAFTSKKINWSDSLDESEDQQLNGVKGYLATVTSKGENDFIVNKSNNGSKITNNAFIGGTDHNRYSREEEWIWYGSNAPENGSQFWQGKKNGYSTNNMYSNWDSGQPDNKKNEDYAEIFPSGYWNDTDPGNVGGYISEWGLDGAEYYFNVSTSNGREGESNPSITISTSREIRSDYQNTYNGTPLIDIPLTVISNEANYSINVTGGNSNYSEGQSYYLEGQSYYSEGRLYLLDIAQNGTVSVEFISNKGDEDDGDWNDKNWQPLRGFDVTLGADGGENIYTFGTDRNTSSGWSGQTWLFDDEPQLSLGKGAWQTIDTSYTSNESINNDLVIFDEDGINEDDSTFGKLGLYDNFGVTWESYLRIPKDGNYTFKVKTDDGARLTVRQNNSDGQELASISSWKDQGPTTYSAEAINDLRTGDVLWIELDYYENGGGATTQLLWNDGSGDAIVPASAMFLSQQLASGQLASDDSNPGTSQQEPSSDESNEPGFQIFANQNSDILDIKLSSSSETNTTTLPSETNTAQRRFDSTKVGDDYSLLSAEGGAVGNDLIDSNNSYNGSYEWKPDSGSQNNIKTINVSALSDPYAEATEQITLSLKEAAGYGVINDDSADSTISQSIELYDSSFVLSLTDVQHASEGELGWITVEIEGDRTAPDSGMRILYAITGGTADANDYLAPKATLSTTDFDPQNYVYLQPGSDSGKIYISTLSDAISEGEESVKVQLLPDIQTTDEDFRYQMYNVGDNDTANLTITDNGLFQAAVIITPEGRTGLSTIRSRVNSEGLQTANFDLHLTSEPENDVAIQLKASSGNLSTETITFTPDNWSQAQTIELTGQSDEQVTTITATAASDDRAYINQQGKQSIVPSGWPDEIAITLWEGGETSPILPNVAVQASQGDEGSSGTFGFTFSRGNALSDPLNVTYTLTGSNSFELSGNSADVLQAPTADRDGQFTIIIPSGQASASITLLPIDDDRAEGDETLTATIIPSENYNTGGETGSATAFLSDNDWADVSFQVQIDESIDTDDQWTEANQIRTSESRTATGESTLVGLALTSRPTAPVTLSIDAESYSSNDLKISNPSGEAALIFTPENWNIRQTLSLQAVDETTDDNDKTVQISFLVSSEDPNYQTSTPALSVIVIDNDATSASEDLANPDINSDDPLVTLSAPSETRLTEGDMLTSTFSVSIDEAADFDRIIFFGLDRSNSNGDPNNLILTSSNSLNTAKGLRQFAAIIGDEELTSIDIDSINETADNFSDLGLTDDFTTTWSGYIYIPEDGYYNFSTSVTGGTRLKLNDQLVIDEYYDADATWTSEHLLLSEDDFISIELDYRSFGTPDPQIQLLWERPNDHGSGFTEETIPIDYLSQVGSHHLVLAAGTTTADFTVAAREDEIKEIDQTFSLELLAARGIEVRVSSQSQDELDNIVLGLTLGTTNVESVTLPANTVLSLGTDEEADGVATDSLASFTFAQETTIHRDREIEAKGTLTLHDTSADAPSIIGMVGAEHRGQYQVLDPFVEIILQGELNSQDESDTPFNTSLQLADTNRSEVTLPAKTQLSYTAPDLDVALTISSSFISDTSEPDLYQVSLLRSDTSSSSATLPAGTTLTYRLNDSEETFNLTLQDTIALQAGEQLDGASVQIEEVSNDLDITSIEPGLVSSTTIQQSFSLQLEEDISIKSGETVDNVLVSVQNVTQGLELENVETGISSHFTPSNPSVIGIQDNDKAGVHFTLDASGGTEIAGDSSIQLAEAGEGVTRYAALTSQPTSSVTLYLETDDDTEVLLQRGDIDQAPAEARIALTFTPENWSESQAFNILPVDDFIQDGDISAKIYSRTNSSDTFYQETGSYSIDKLPSISILNTDDEVSSLLIGIQQNTVTEAENGFLNFALTTEPTANVSVSLTPSDHQFTLNDRGIGQNDSLIFTPQNWNVLQTLELHAVDDDAVEDITQSLLEIQTTSQDNNYEKLPIDAVTIEIVDNDLPTASIIPVSDSSEEAEPGRFRIELSEPAPSSAGSNGVLVQYNITDLQLDSEGLHYASDPSSINKITQLPGSTIGQIRIAPGQTSSDVFVVPIDDFVEDSVDKSFTVSLTEGKGYELDNTSLYNKATVRIINNDVAGIIILLSGDPLQVSETGNPGEFSVALLSQPRKDVVLTLNELKTKINEADIKQLGDSSSADFVQTLTFKPENWFVAQTVSVTAYDDFIIEDSSSSGELVTYNASGQPINSSGDVIADSSSLLHSGLHPAQLQYSFSSEDSSYDSSSNDADHFTNTIQKVNVLDIQLPETTADSLQNALTNLQEGIDSLALPIVGSLDGKTGGGLRKFITNLANNIRAIGTPTPAKISELISSEINEATGLSNASVTLAMVEDDGEAAIDVGFTFADAYDVFDIPLDANFGLPGLGLQSQGSIEADFNYDATLKFHFPRNGEAELITDPDETYLSADFVTELSDDFSLTGGLGFLQLEGHNQASPNETAEGLQGRTTGMDVTFNLDLAGGAGEDGGLTWTELTDSDTNLEEIFQYEIGGEAAMSFGVVTSVNGTAAIPSFSFDLSGLLPLFDYSNLEEAEEQGLQTQTDIYFDNINLDLGSYITQMLKPVVDGIDNILNPLYPVVDALYADTQIFDTIGLRKTFDNDKDGHVSPIDLAEWFADLYAIIQPGQQAEKLKQGIEDTVEFLDVVKGVMDLVKDLEEMAEQGSFYVDLGSYALSDFSSGDPNAVTPEVPELDENPDEPTTQNLSTDTKKQANAGGNSDPDNPEAGDSNSSFAEVMEQLDELGFVIPLIDDPSNAINLLLGNPVDLFTWNMPGMGMSSEIDKSFPIYSGIDGIIEGGFGIDANLGFGFDTSGLQEWMDDEFADEDFWKVFNGFYVNDRDADGIDIPEFTLDASMGAGLGLSAVVVRADITGGLEAEASLDLLDEGEIAGTDDGRIYGDEITSRLDNPLDLFELIGSLAAYLQAKVKIGIDMGFYSIWDTVWQEKLAEIPIFEFGVGGSYGSGTASNGYLSDSTVFFDANFNGRIDSLEPSTIVGDDSHYNLKVSHRDFDRNRNGIIDPEEGRLVVFGGTDTTTGLPLEIPMLAPLGDMLTPLTTLHTLAQELGYDDNTIQARLNQIFNLNDFDYLTQDPLLGIKGAASIGDEAIKGHLAAYTAHIDLMVGLNLFSGTLKKAFRDAKNNNQHDIEVLRAFTKSLFEATTTEIDRDAAISSALLTIVSNMYPDASKDDTKSLKKIARFVATANSAVAARLKQLNREYITAGGGDIPDSFISSLYTLKAEILNSYNSKINMLSEGLYRITDLKQQRKSLGSRLKLASTGFINNLLADTSNLSANEVASLMPGVLKSFTTDQVKNLSPNAMKGLNADHIAKLSDDAASVLSKKQVKKLPPLAITGLTKSQASKLSAETVSGLTGFQTTQMTIDAFKGLDHEQLASLRKDAITGLSKVQLKTITSDEISAFKVGRITSIASESISGLKPAALNALSKKQAKALNNTQLAGLSKKQIKKADDFINALTDQQRDALSFDPGRSSRLVNPFADQNDLSLLPGLDPLA